MTNQKSISVLDIDNERRLRREKLQTASFPDNKEWTTTLRRGSAFKRSSNSVFVLIDKNSRPTKKQSVLIPYHDVLTIRGSFTSHRSLEKDLFHLQPRRSSVQSRRGTSPLLTLNDDSAEETRPITRSKWDEPISLSNLRPRKNLHLVLETVTNNDNSPELNKNSVLFSSSSDLLLPYMPL